MTLSPSPAMPHLLTTATWRPPWGSSRGPRPISSTGQPLVIVWNGSAVEPPRGATWTVGRGPGARLQAHDESLSRTHAQVRRSSGALRVEDLQSTNGVWCSAKRVDTASLSPDDVALLGRRPMLVARRAPDGSPSDTIVWQGIWARSRSSLQLLERVALAAQLDAPALIRGESGTGKEGVARALHRAGPRAKGPWVVVNCAALPESLAESELFGAVRGAFTGADRDRKGAFERAHTGTLFLDEIGELKPSTQAKLLRAVESGEITPVGAGQPRRIDVRIVAATWRDLERQAGHGSFRFDLLQRLSVVQLFLTPLRQRRRDISALYAKFLHEMGLKPSHVRPFESLEAWSWPGNARSVRALVMSDLFGDLQTAHTPALPTPQRDARQVATEAVERHAGNRSRAARSLGVSRSTLYRWLSAPSSSEDARVDTPREGDG